MSTATSQPTSPAESIDKAVKNETEPLIGAENLAMPSWTVGYAEVSKTGTWRTVAAMPTAIRLIFRMAWLSAPWLTILTLMLEAVSGCITAFGLLATAGVFTQLLESGPTPQRVLAALPAMALVVCSYSVRALLDAASGITRGILIPKIILAAQSTLNIAVARVDLISFEDADFRELAHRSSEKGVDSIERSALSITDLISSLVAMVAAVVTAGLLNPFLAPALFLAAAVDSWSAMRASKIGFKAYLKSVTRRFRLSTVSNLLLDRDVAVERHAFALQNRLVDEHQRIARDVTADEIRAKRNKALVRLVGRTLAGIGTAIAYFVLGVLLYAGALPLALAGTAMIAMRTASTALSDTMRSINNVYEQILYVDFYQKLLDDCLRRQQKPTGKSAPIDPDTIRLENVSFSYPSQDALVLKGIDLTIQRGEVIALVGVNGSGKTTLGKLITGLYQPTSGRVLWDGVDIATVDPHTVHDQISVISQNPARWPMTAGLNVRIGRLDRNDPDRTTWQDVITRSGADEVINSLELGENALLTREFKEGHDLSGGQWQRISVARGMYRDAAILIADEPTAALDARAEAVVFDGLQHASRFRGQMGGKRTTVLVTHRLANIRHADRIIVLNEGCIVEEGIHSALMAQNGLYRELFDIQASAYADVNDSDALTTTN